MRFSPDARLRIFPGRRRFPVSPRLYGVFFEEINHAGDGGLSAELARNRGLKPLSVPPRRAFDGGSVYPSSSHRVLELLGRHRCEFVAESELEAPIVPEEDPPDFEVAADVARDGGEGRLRFLDRGGIWAERDYWPWEIGEESRSVHVCGWSRGPSPKSAAVAATRSGLSSRRLDGRLFYEARTPPRPKLLAAAALNLERREPIVKLVVPGPEELSAEIRVEGAGLTGRATAFVLWGPPDGSAPPAIEARSLATGGDSIPSRLGARSFTVLRLPVV